MPFKAKIFQENVERLADGAARNKLVKACAEYHSLTTAQKRVQCIHEMMSVLDQEVDEKIRWEIMEACGRCCIGISILEKAKSLRQKERDLDVFLDRLNKVRIGGGHLRREGDNIFPAYDRCYCGSVSKTKTLFSGTYCRCSCGWFKKLFEDLFRKKVEVRLLKSIIQGNDRCEFLIQILPDLIEI
jgi:predicted hydrocarbon binding protein